MEVSIATELSEIASLVAGAAFRSWRNDLVPWTLILDFDLTRASDDGAHVASRAWLIFMHASDVSIAMDNERVGAGFRIDDVLRVERPRTSPKGVLEYPFEVRPSTPWRFKMSIVATECVLLYGRRTRPDSDWYLSRSEHLVLGTDEEMLEALRALMPAAFDTV
jgi:hypothetical protein